MTIDVYTSTGTKKGTATLPKGLFEVEVNEGLLHQAVVRLQSAGRKPIANVKKRGEIRGSTRKLFQQKGTGRARRGQIRSALLRGGNKAFGPFKNASYQKDMPQKMRRKALACALSAQASAGAILGLEDYPEKISTKGAATLLQKMPVELGRKIVIVTPEKHAHLCLSAGNIPGVNVVMAQYLNTADVLGATYIVFMVDAIKKLEEVHGGGVSTTKKKETATKEAKEETKEKAAPKKAPAKKSTTKATSTKKA